MSVIPDDHVCLLLIPGKSNNENEKQEWFYLDIPIDIIETLCLKPRKYLLYLAWCILGLDVEYNKSLTLGLGDENGVFKEIDNDGDLESGGIYALIPDPPPGAAVVNLEVFRARTTVPSSSETTTRRIHSEFRKRLLERDTCCVFTQCMPLIGKDLHIIPYNRGNEWLKFIIDNRPHETSDFLTDLSDINDVRNGFFAMSAVHTLFDSRQVVVIKTPNPVLGTDDIPQCEDPIPLNDDVRHPRDSRYTAQWLVPPGRHTRPISNNCDAAFAKNSKAKKPSALLLHYNYGAAAVRLWGHNTHILNNISEKNRPEKPTLAAPSGPRKKVHNRTIVLEKRRAALAASLKAAKKSAKSKGKSKADWDEDDVMLFLWGNSRAASEQHLKKSEEKREGFEKWRKGSSLM